jgi:O-succinylbenzoate synthase
LLEVEDMDGTIGWSECVAQEYPNYGPETIDTAWLAIREWLLPLLRPREIHHPQEVFPVLNSVVRGHLMAKAGLEMASWDIFSRRANVSLSTFLGGTRPEVPVGISIGLQPSPQHLVEKVNGCIAQGYRKIKLKIKPGADLPQVEAVRTAFGNDLPLSVDANSSYTLEHVQLLRSLDRFDLMMLEQPLQHDDLVRHAILQKEIDTPICLDESITGVERTEDMIQLGSGRIVNIKPGRVGGFAQSVLIHDLCARNGIPVWCGGMLESGIGRAHNVALAGLPNFVIPGDLSPSRRYWERDIVAPEWTMSREGMVRVPKERPGIGVDVDQDRIDNLTVRREEC